MYVSCSLVVTCWEKVYLLALLYVMFSCVFVTFPKGVLGQVWHLIVLIPDLCLLLYYVAPLGEHSKSDHLSGYKRAYFMYEVGKIEKKRNWRRRKNMLTVYFNAL